MVTIRSGVGWSYSSYATEAVLGLAVVAVVLRHVTPAEYGALMLALSLASLTTILDLGLLGLLIPAVVGERERGGSEGAARLVSAALVWLAGAGLAAMLVCVFVALALPGPFNVSGALVGVTAKAMVMAGAAVMVTFLATALELTHAAFGAFGRVSRVQMAVAIARAVTTVAMMVAGYGVLTLAAIHLGAAVLRLLLLALSVPTFTGKLTFSVSAAGLLPLRPLLSNRGWATADNVARRAASAADSIALAALATPAAVATYNVGARLPGHLNAIANRGIDVTMPFLSAHHAREAEEDLRSLLARTIVVALLLLAPVAAAGVLLAPWIVRLLGGAAYSSAAPVLQLLMLAIAVRAFSIPAYNTLYAKGLIGTAARIGGCEAIAKILLTVALIPRYGAPGAAAATLLSTAVFTYAWFLPAAMRAAGLRWSDVGKVFGRAFRSLLPSPERAG